MGQGPRTLGIWNEPPIIFVLKLYVRGASFPQKQNYGYGQTVDWTHFPWLKSWQLKGAQGTELLLTF